MVRSLSRILPLALLVAAPALFGDVYELRTYTTNPGKLDALNARFRDHTIRLFQKHGIESVGYWTRWTALLRYGRQKTLVARTGSV